MKKIKTIKLIFIVICIISIMLPIVFTNYHGGQSNNLDNRFLAFGPLAYFNIGKKIDITKWINDNIGFRTTMLGLKGYIEYNFLHKSPTSKVMLGKDGFMFYTLDDNIEIAKNNYKFTKREKDESIKNLLLTRDILNNLNKTFIFTIAPSKVSIYPEYLNNGNYHKTITPIDYMDEKLKNEIYYINLKEPLYYAKKNMQGEFLYFKTDTHWNQLGAYVAYKAIIEYMNNKMLFGQHKEEIKDIKFTKSTRRGEFANMMGGSFVLKPEETVAGQIINSNIKNLEKPEYIEEYQKKYKPVRVYRYTNNTKDKSILVIGDSMFATWGIPQLLANHFKIYTHVWKREFKSDLIENDKSEIVLLEIAERYTNKLPMILGDFVKKHYQPAAQVMSKDIPEVMENGKSYSFTIEIKNIGKYNLGYSYLTMIGILLDKDAYKNIDQGIRFYLPKDTIIKPGEIYSFKVNNFVPNYKGKYMMFKVGEEYINWISNPLKIELR